MCCRDRKKHKDASKEDGKQEDPPAEPAADQVRCHILEARLRPESYPLPRDIENITVMHSWSAVA